MTRRIAVVLPAYNEAGSLPGLLRRFLKAREAGLDEITLIVVDDGSTDGTSGAVMNWTPGAGWVRVIRHAANRGLGAALGTGLSAAMEGLEDRDAVVVMDADDTHDPADIAGMIERLDDADVVIGSRFADGGGVEGVPVHRRLLSDLSSVLLRNLCPLPGVKDYTSGFRAYRAGALRAIVQSRLEVFGTPGFAVTAGLLLALGAAGARIGEVPVTVRYDRKKGPSKMHLWATVRGILTLVRQYRRGDRRKGAPVWTD